MNWRTDKNAGLRDFRCEGDRDVGRQQALTAMDAETREQWQENRSVEAVHVLRRDGRDDPRWFGLRLVPRALRGSSPHSERSWRKTR